MSELLMLLQSVPDSYDDFVIGMMSFAQSSEFRKQKLTEFLKQNPDANTSRIIEFTAMELDLLKDHFSGKTIRATVG